MKDAQKMRHEMREKMRKDVWEDAHMNFDPKHAQVQSPEFEHYGGFWPAEDDEHDPTAASSGHQGGGAVAEAVHDLVPQEHDPVAEAVHDLVVPSQEQETTDVFSSQEAALSQAQSGGDGSEDPIVEGSPMIPSSSIY